MPKLYSGTTTGACPLSSEPCLYGGNKRFNWGFAWGTRPYCYKAHKFIYVLTGVIVCPLGKAKEAR